MTPPPNAAGYIMNTQQPLDEMVREFSNRLPEESRAEFQARMTALMQNFDTANQEMEQAADEVMQSMPAVADSYFNLSKEAQFVDPMMSDQPADAMFDDRNYDQFNNPQAFDSHVDLFGYLEEMLGSGDPEQIRSVRNDLLGIVENDATIDDQGIRQPNPQQVISDGLQDYLVALQQDNEEARAGIAAKMFRVMPQSGQGDSMVHGIQEAVAETNAAIRKLAQELAAHQLNKESSGGKPFNLNKLKKEAQHKGLENVIIHGPSNHIDPFTGQLINDWHIYERNKGWGLKMDDALFVDYEAIWRGTIMDKYSRPYRDEDGNWVGGYIEKRFEVDKWIPPANNYQLKPGQKRRPYLSEYRSTEARLQHRRSTDNSMEYNDKSEPFNWSKMAAAKKQQKTAQPGSPYGQYVFKVTDLVSGNVLQKLDAPGLDEARMQAQSIAEEYGDAVGLQMFDFSIDPNNPLQEDLIYPKGGFEEGMPELGVAASVDTKKKVTD